ncbi:MAG: radical SAM protein [Peptococcaceae bacterium]|nr:radical SAM protein [Peptococcaceae bacterium]
MKRNPSGVSKGRLADAFKIMSGRIPGQLVIQITNCCNGACPQCGMRKTADISRHSLASETINNALKQCAANGIEAVSLTGGEPFLNMSRFWELCEDAGQAGISYLRSGTNGYMFVGADTEQLTEFASRLAATKVRNFWISLDSADTATHEKMRGLPGVIDGIRKALPIFHAHGVFPAANLGINRHITGNPISRLQEFPDTESFLEAFKVGFTAFFNKAVNLGFTMANVCYPMSSDNEDLDTPTYGAISDDFTVSFSPEERRLVFQALLETIPTFRNQIRIFSPLSVLYAMSVGGESLLFPCLGGIRYFYMDSRDGHLYPCGYLGDLDLGGDLSEAVRQTAKEKPHCLKCHWECFRDPSQLFGLARYMIRHPFSTLILRQPDSRLLNLWFGDLRYYIKHNFFDGRTPFEKREAINHEYRKPLPDEPADLPQNG